MLSLCINIIQERGFFIHAIISRGFSAILKELLWCEANQLQIPMFLCCYVVYCMEYRHEWHVSVEWILLVLLQGIRESIVSGVQSVAQNVLSKFRRKADVTSQ